MRDTEQGHEVGPLQFTNAVSRRNRPKTPSVHRPGLAMAPKALKPALKPQSRSDRAAKIELWALVSSSVVWA